MPLKWFRSHRDSSSINTEDEITRSSTEATSTKPKTKRSKSMTHRSRRSRSQGPGLRAMIGMGRSMQYELDMSTAVAAEEEQRRILYQTKNHRRFTIHGISTHHKHSDAGSSCNSTPAGSPMPPTTPSHARAWHYGLGSNRTLHGRSPRTPLKNSLTSDSHPSIIFIDCPP
ncbi:unnamed protein product [Peronospora belbahrii]|uniref:Uncharacterized protein n=1 Tax=Peronospora belbahrii TaxID=622444 RepID=A0AAU9L2C9_9STRA|nr:unnamed protein product [Peronospora belbahrii]CAH0521492.1 unnamed protein product [Peronospora belbahrii]